MTVPLAELVAAQPAASATAAAWAAASVLTGILPTADSVRALRRRAAVLSWLIAGGLVSFGVALVVPAGGSVTREQVVLLAAPAAGVALSSLPLLGGLRATARAFSPAPGAPTPPTLRASAAHPLLALPVQVVAMTATAGALFAAGVVEGSASLAVALTLITVASGGAALFNAVRYGRLTELATRPARIIHAVPLRAEVGRPAPPAMPVALAVPGGRRAVPAGRA
jgi:hypothetical protein